MSPTPLCSYHQLSSVRSRKTTVRSGRRISPARAPRTWLEAAQNPHFARNQPCSLAASIPTIAALSIRDLRRGQSQQLSAGWLGTRCGLHWPITMLRSRSASHGSARLLRRGRSTMGCLVFSKLVPAMRILCVRRERRGIHIRQKIVAFARPFRRQFSLEIEGGWDRVRAAVLCHVLTTATFSLSHPASHRTASAAGSTDLASIACAGSTAQERT